MLRQRCPACADDVVRCREFASIQFQSLSHSLLSHTEIFSNWTANTFSYKKS